MKAAVLIYVLGMIWGAQANAACDQTLSPGANVSSAVSAATAGSTICLNSGTYSALNLSGVSKNPRVTVRSATAKGAQLSFNLSNGTKGITLDSLTFTSGNISGSTTRDITVSHSDFINNGKMVIDGVVRSNILLDGNTHNNINVSGQGVAGRVSLPYGNSIHSGVTVQNSDFIGGCADGIQSGVGLNIYNNRFMNMLVGNCANDPHTDAVQFVFHSGEGPHIKGNYFYNNEQALTAFDRVANALIEDNVLDAGPAGRPWQIEWYSDTNSVIRHNTVLYQAKCAYNSSNCGHISITRKAADPAGKGTVVVNNIATSINVSDGSTVSERHNNLVRMGAVSGDITGAPTYIGGASPTTWQGFQLASNSLGIKAGSDGLNVGANYFGSEILPQPTPVPTPTPTPTPVPTPEPAPTPAPVPAAGDQKLFSSQLPAQMALTDGLSVNYELGMRFTVAVAGQIKAIRFYKSASESGIHTGKIYSSSGALLASVVFANETSSGWQQQALATPLNVSANVEYTVSVNTGGSYYVATNNGLASQVSSGNLRSVVGNNGVYGSVGARPTKSYLNSNYFRDVVFNASVVSTPAPQPAPAPAPAPTPAPVLTSKFKVGDRVQAFRRVNVRASGSLSGTLLGTQVTGAQGKLVAGPTSVNGIIWWKIDYDNGVDGFSGEDNFNLAIVSAPAPAPTPVPVQTGWPNASNTGVPANVVLSAYTGPMKITTAGTVIDGKIINGTLIVQAANVVIKNSRLQGYTYFGVDAENASNFTIQDCDLVGPGTAAPVNAAILGSGTILRNDISKSENGIVLTSGASIVKGNFIHNLEAPGSDPHYDGISVQGGQNGVLIEDNFVDSRDTSAIFIKNDFGAINNITVNHNYLTGTMGFDVYCDGRGGGGAITNVKITNNVMKKGGYGYISIDNCSPTVSGNVDAVSGLSVK